MSNKLTQKQAKFAMFYVELGNATEAYKKAYQTSNMLDNTIYHNACELLKNNKVATRVRELELAMRDRSEITKERLLSELEAILDAKITDYLTFDGKKIAFKNFDELTDKQIKAIDGIKQGRYGIELTLHGKSWTIERICKMLGYYAPDKLMQVSTSLADLLKPPDNE